jgi:acetyl-CoA acetyltransferase
MLGGTINRESGAGPTGFMGDMGGLIAHHAYSAANWVAMHCQRHMHLYGTTKEQLGWLALTSRGHAARNPAAVLREPLTMDDYLAGRPISTPFGLYDCDIPVDGSIAVVVSDASHRHGTPSPAISVAAFGGSPGTGGWIKRPDYPHMAATDAATEMWSRTDLSPADVQVAELYDGFSFLTFAWLEALGFCAEGESGPFVEGGSRITMGGRLPLNTYGGQLSAGRMHGYWTVHEACLQLRGQAGARQVTPQPEVAAVSVGGGPIGGCVLLERTR